MKQSIYFHTFNLIIFIATKKKKTNKQQIKIKMFKDYLIAAN